MIIHTTCIECGQLLQASALDTATHPDCPDRMAEIEARFLATAAAGDQHAADGWALSLDNAADPPATLLEAALAYARQSWPVFPCQPRGKAPYASGKQGGAQHGFHDATTDTGRITRWWKHHPDHNIGVPTGHLFDVIDIDYEGKPEALDWWHKLKDNSDLEIDGLATTPRGLHVYILPSGARNSSKVGAINGVDYRGIGGYVVTPPSVRDDGVYKWWVAPSPRIKNQQ